MYIPKPEDTANIILPKDLVDLTEKIAENVHDVWALGRINDGWTYGQTEDPVRKLSPLLVPYGELPESEKDFDRNTAMETLRFVLKTGYSITKASPVSEEQY